MAMAEQDNQWRVVAKTTNGEGRADDFPTENGSSNPKTTSRHRDTGPENTKPKKRDTPRGTTQYDLIVFVVMLNICIY